MTEAKDPFPIKRIDHIEFYVGNAKQSAAYYRDGFGFLNTAYRGLETGDRSVASYVLQQGQIRFVVSAATVRDHEIAAHTHKHGDGVAVIALEVPDAGYAYEFALSKGASGVQELTAVKDGHGELRYSIIQGYGDTQFKFVDRSDYNGPFAPGYDARDKVEGRLHDGIGLASVDHVVGNVELGGMDRWVKFFEEVMGFSMLVHFDEDDISTEYSALMSKVVQDGTGKVKFPINEPAEGRRKSQIQEYLDYYGGPGVQHIALTTGDIIKTVSELRARGIEFLHVPGTYYENLTERVGDIKESIDQIAELNILVDRDEEGYLLQIFTKPVEDIPTIFYEIIQRHGSRGFGVGNFKALFEAIEQEQALRGNL
ncbi:MAG: 4-hydroxyphenylpyruvate dioxygenase [Planctomycetota bacterium]|nr:4-hydroxyphenylpyruvate dioxygenase [Planctomycetota bacterium]